MYFSGETPMCALNSFLKKDELTELIDNAKEKAAEADNTLKAELEKAINEAKSAITAAYEKAISDAIAKLEIADKNNASALNEAIENLETMIGLAEEAAERLGAGLGVAYGGVP